MKSSDKLRLSISTMSWNYSNIKLWFDGKYVMCNINAGIGAMVWLTNRVKIMRETKGRDVIVRRNASSTIVVVILMLRISSINATTIYPDQRSRSSSNSSSDHHFRVVRGIAGDDDELDKTLASNLMLSGANGLDHTLIKSQDYQATPEFEVESKPSNLFLSNETYKTLKAPMSSSPSIDSMMVSIIDDNRQWPFLEGENAMAVNTNRAATIRSEFGNHTESSEFEHQISEMSANKTTRAKDNGGDVGVNHENIDREIKIEATNSSASNQMRPIWNSNEFNQNKTSKNGAIFTGAKQPILKKRRKIKGQHKQKQLNSDQRPTKMVSYISASKNQPESEQFMSSSIVSQQASSNHHDSMSPIRFIEFGQAAGNDLLPNYHRNLFDWHHVATTAGNPFKNNRMVYMPSPNLANYYLQNSIKTNQQTSNLRGPFEMEQLQTSGSSMNHRKKFLNNTSTNNSNLTQEAPHEASKFESSNIRNEQIPATSQNESNQLRSSPTGNSDSDDDDGLDYDADDDSKLESTDKMTPGDNDLSMNKDQIETKGDHQRSRSVTGNGVDESKSVISGEGNEGTIATMAQKYGPSDEIKGVSDQQATTSNSALQQMGGGSNQTTTTKQQLDKLQVSDDDMRAHQLVANKPITESLASNQQQQSSNEILVGPFKSEAEAPATITLAGVVYQKSGVSSALIQSKFASNRKQSTNGNSDSKELKPRLIMTLSQANQAPFMTLSKHLQQQQPLQSVQSNLVALEQPVYLEPQLQQASDNPLPQTTIVNLQANDGRTVQFAANQPFSSSGLFADISARNPIDSQQQLTLFGGASLNSNAPVGTSSGELLYSTNSNSKPLTTSSIVKPSTSYQLKAKKQLAFAPISSSLALSPTSNQQHVSSSQPDSNADSTTVWTIGKLNSGSSTMADELGVSSTTSTSSSSSSSPTSSNHQSSDHQHQLNSLLLQQMASAASSQPTTSNGMTFQMAAVAAGQNNHQLELGESSQTSESKTHEDKHHHHQAPIVIVQKDVKPVKYHLLRAYLKLRRLLRPFEATYVFPNEPNGRSGDNTNGSGVTSTFLKRRLQRSQARPRRLGYILGFK